MDLSECHIVLATYIMCKLPAELETGLTNAGQSKLVDQPEFHT